MEYHTEDDRYPQPTLCELMELEEASIQQFNQSLFFEAEWTAKLGYDIVTIDYEKRIHPSYLAGFYSGIVCRALTVVNSNQADEF